MSSRAFAHLYARLVLADVRRDLELEAERDQVVTGEVVEVARDPRALVGARRLVKERAGREQLGVRAGERRAGAPTRRRAERDRRDGEDLEAEERDELRRAENRARTRG